MSLIQTQITGWLSWLLIVLVAAATSADLRGAAGISLETFVILNFTEAAIAQLGERQTEDLKVPGAIPGLGTRRTAGAGARVRKLCRCHLSRYSSPDGGPGSLLSLFGAATSADLRGAPGFSMATFAILNFPEAAIAQLGERQTEDLKVPGSIPGLGTGETARAGARMRKL